MSILKTENASRKNGGKACKKKSRNLPKSMRLYLIGFIVVFVICCLCAVFQMTNSSFVTITINSASVSKGQNPDGSAFDIYEIFSDDRSRGSGCRSC